jgi:hypothetical protein
MFVGHYGPSFAAKGMRKSIPLWVLFIAVQLLDVFWSIFVLLGIEKVRITSGITATNPLDLYYMPYTHSLIGAMLWAIGATIVYYLCRRTDGWAPATFVVRLYSLTGCLMCLYIDPTCPCTTIPPRSVLGSGITRFSLSYLNSPSFLVACIYI